MVICSAKSSTYFRIFWYTYTSSLRLQLLYIIPSQYHLLILCLPLSSSNFYNAWSTIYEIDKIVASQNSSALMKK